MRKLTRAFAPIVFVLSLLLSGCALPMPSSSMVSMDELPAYSDSAYVEIDGNQPFFTDADKQETGSFEEYSDLDYLGRCGTAYANVGQELMPADGEKRGSIGQVKPTGWHTVKYDCVDGAPEAKSMISAGAMTATAAQSPIRLGQITAQTIYAILNGEDYEKEITVPVELVTKDNVNGYDMDGWQ